MSGKSWILRDMYPVRLVGSRKVAPFRHPSVCSAHDQSMGLLNEPCDQVCVTEVLPTVPKVGIDWMAMDMFGSRGSGWVMFQYV